MYSILLLALMTSLTDAECPKIDPPKGPFDINKYLGVWFEIVRSGYPNGFEFTQGCVYANYTRFNRNELKFVHKGQSVLTWQRRSSTYIARRTDQPNLLKLKFDRVSDQKNYLILDTDFENYAIVYNCRVVNGYPKNYTMKYGWILGRKKHLPKEIIKKGIKKLVDLGIPESNFIRTQHPERKCTM